jgi:predicted phage-related endonuclease
MIEEHAIESKEQWLKLREKDVTASVAAAMPDIDLHSYITPLQLWTEKAGKVPVGATDNPAMRRGRLIERLAIPLIEEARPDWTVTKSQVYLRDREHRLGGTPDFEVLTPSGLRGNVQFKSVEPYLFDRTWKVDGQIVPPTWIGIQTLLETYLAGADFAMIGVCRISYGVDFDLVEVPLTDGLIERLQQAALAFWASIEKDQPPEPNFERDADILRQLYAKTAIGKTIDLTGNNRIGALASLDEEWAVTEKNAKKQRESIKAEVLHLLGDAEAGLINGEVAVTAKKTEVAAEKKPRPGYSYRKVLFKLGTAV